MKNTYIIETEKLTKIIDIHNTIRYTILFKQGQTITSTGELINGYAVIVNRIINNSDDNIEQTIVDRYPQNNEYDDNYYKLQSIYKEKIKKYAQIIEAETCNIDETTIYKERINYKIVTPSCCATCKWSKLMSHKKLCKCDEHVDHHNMKIFECHNPKNQQIFTYSLEFPCIEGKKHFDDELLYGWRKLPWQKPTQYNTFNERGELPLTNIFLPVDPCGLCDQYEKTELKQQKKTV